MPRKRYRPITRDFLKPFGLRLRKAREEAGYESATEAARAADMTPSQLIGYENGSKFPGYDTLHRLVNTLHLDCATLFAPATAIELGEKQELRETSKN
jgi:transcriptional regulator with XRE-family HTH domain